MSSVETGQMSAVETRQMSSAETKQMRNSETGQRPVLPVDICLVSAEDICLVSTCTSEDRKALALPGRAVRMGGSTRRGLTRGEESEEGGELGL